MRVTIIREDGFVAIDGRAFIVDLSDMPEDLHAVQWDGESGHVERQGWMNQTINSIADFQAWIDRWTAAAYAEDNPEPVEPVRFIPQSVTRYQGRAALLQMGLLDDIDAHYAALPTDTADEALNLKNRLAKERWAGMLNFERDSDELVELASAFGLSATQVDDLFCFAATIK